MRECSGNVSFFYLHVFCLLRLDCVMTQSNASALHLSEESAVFLLALSCCISVSFTGHSVSFYFNGKNAIQNDE